MYCLQIIHGLPVPSVLGLNSKMLEYVLYYAFYLVCYMCVYIWILPFYVGATYRQGSPRCGCSKGQLAEGPAVTVVLGQLTSVLVCWCSHLSHINNGNNTHTYWITINWPYIPWTYTYCCQCLFIVGLSTTASVRRHSWSDVSPDTILLCSYMDIPWIASKHQMNSHKYINIFYISIILVSQRLCIPDAPHKLYINVYKLYWIICVD